MPQPRNHQEFLRMQQQAVAAARDMQRRSKFNDYCPPCPPPNRNPACPPNPCPPPPRRPIPCSPKPSCPPPKSNACRNSCKSARPHQKKAPPPPPDNGLAGLFSLFGGMGSSSKSHQCNCNDCRNDDESQDSTLVILLMSLLQKEQTDPGLMMALMYIMM